VTPRQDRIVRHHQARTVALFAVSLLLVSTTSSAQTLTMQQLLGNHVEQRFGMFIHYNMNTYKPGWGENRVAPATFAPQAATVTPSLISGPRPRSRPG